MNNRGTQVHDAESASSQAACSQCAMGKLCFPHAVPVAFRALFPMVLEKRLQLARGEFLFHARDPQTAKQRPFSLYIDDAFFRPAP